MTEIGAAQRRWPALSERPNLIVGSAASIWRGFEFQEIEVPAYGTFDRGSGQIALSLNRGPMKVRFGGVRKPFRDYPVYPNLTLPGDGTFGAWQGAQRGMHLFADQEAIERVTQQSFRREAFQRPNGPTPAIEHLLRALHADVVAGHPSGPMLGEAVISSILHQLLPGSAEKYALRTAYPSQKELQRLIELIEAELSGPLTLTRLANSMGFSVRHLSRTFHAATGLTPHQYVLRRRIGRARELIEKSHLCLEEIAETVGFANHAHMTSTFRRLVGVTPAHFRGHRNSIQS
jgi:AraC family transcriptional regulator